MRANESGSISNQNSFSSIKNGSDVNSRSMRDKIDGRYLEGAEELEGVERQHQRTRETMA